MIRIAHISDLHFSKFSLSPAQFFSKQWLGNMNLLFNRSKQYLNERPFSLVPEFKEKGITHVIISGDLTTTSSHQEYKIAKHFVEVLEKEGMKVFVIPGNHDHYTKKSDRTKRFYRTFPSPKNSEFLLSQHGVCSIALTSGWHLVLMDTALATTLVSSNGYFSPVVEENFKKLIEKIPPKENVLLVNPFLSSTMIHHAVALFGETNFFGLLKAALIFRCTSTATPIAIRLLICAQINSPLSLIAEALATKMDRGTRWI